MTHDQVAKVFPRLALLLVSLPLLTAYPLAASDQDPNSMGPEPSDRTGLWVRSTYGAGRSSVAVGGERFFSGITVGGISIGKFVRKNLIVFVDISETTIAGVLPEGEAGDDRDPANLPESASLGGLGVGVGYQFSSRDIFLSSSVMGGALSEGEGDAWLLRSRLGLVLSVGMEKGFVVSDRWRIGVGGLGRFWSAGDQHSRDRWTATSAALSFSASFARRGWRPRRPSLTLVDTLETAAMRRGSKPKPKYALLAAFLEQGIPSAGYAYAGDWGRSIPSAAVTAVGFGLLLGGGQEGGSYGPDPSQPDDPDGCGGVDFFVPQDCHAVCVAGLALILGSRFWATIDAFLTAEAYNRRLLESVEMGWWPSRDGVGVALGYRF